MGKTETLRGFKTLVGLSTHLTHNHISIGSNQLKGKKLQNP